MSYRVFIGIDPGGSGAVASMNEAGVPLCFKMPATERDLFLIFRPMSPLHRCPPAAEAHAVLERVWSAPGWGHVGAFSFGKNYGALRMALTAAEIPFDEVLPKDWQRAMGVSYPKGKPRDKNISKRRAQALFPALTVTHATADALLLAEYCRRLHCGLLQPKGSAHGKEENKGPFQHVTFVEGIPIYDADKSPYAKAVLAEAQPAQPALDGAGPHRSPRGPRRSHR